MENQNPSQEPPLVLSDEEIYDLAVALAKSGPVTADQSNMFVAWANDARLRQQTLDGVLSGSVEIVGWEGLFPKFQMVKDDQGEQGE